MSAIVTFKGGTIGNDSSNNPSSINATGTHGERVDLFLLPNDKPDSGRKRGKSFKGFFRQGKFDRIVGLVRANQAEITISGNATHGGDFEPIDFTSH